VGLDSQLVSEYPATPDGQKNFVLQKTLVKESEYGLICVLGRRMDFFQRESGR
jgi:hypothetical protein